MPQAQGSTIGEEEFTGSQVHKFTSRPATSILAEANKRRYGQVSMQISPHRTVSNETIKHILSLSKQYQNTT